MAPHSNSPPIIRHPLVRAIAKHWRRIGLMIWLGLMAVGWLGYLPYVLGLPGIHGLAVVYNLLVYIIFALILGSLYGWPFIGAAFVMLILLSFIPECKRYARAGLRILLTLGLAILMTIAALLPSFILQYQPYAQKAIAPWHSVYRAIYVSPLDNNYGDVMLVRCRLGLCYQVYRGETNISSIEDAVIEFNPETNQVALYLEGRWVYVRSPGSPPCKENLRANEYGKCNFIPIP